MSSEDLDRKSALDGAADPVSPVSPVQDLHMDEKHAAHTITAAVLPDESEDDDPAKSGNSDNIIITGEDASHYLLPIRDDHDPALTFRSIVLSTGLACFQAVMSQIYLVCIKLAHGLLVEKLRADQKYSSNRLQ